jgi:hypothetical protein
MPSVLRLVSATFCHVAASMGVLCVGVFHSVVRREFRVKKRKRGKTNVCGSTRNCHKKIDLPTYYQIVAINIFIVGLSTSTSATDDTGARRLCY